MTRINLVVLCVQCHADAHLGLLSNVKGVHGRVLTPEEIKHHKNLWIKEVKDRSNSFRQHSLDSKNYAIWCYLNNERFFKLLLYSQIDCSKIEHYQYLFNYGIIDEDGIPIMKYNPESSYWLRGLEIPVAAKFNVYLKTLIREVLITNGIKLINFNDVISNNVVLEKGSLILFKCSRCFSDNTSKTNKTSSGFGQNRLAKSINRNLEFTFDFDCFQCLSNSAKEDQMKGNQKGASVVARIKDYKKENGVLQLDASVLCVGYYFEDIESYIR